MSAFVLLQRGTLVAVALGLLGVSGAFGADADGDGVDDSGDNCTLIVNPNQCDTDSDGYGNHCDGDFDNTGVPRVNSIDFSSYFLLDLQTGVDMLNRGTNMSCDGIPAVSVSDYSLYFAPQLALGYPGPSGLACAGTPPCAAAAGATGEPCD
jgi:hypothetical protein